MYTICPNGVLVIVRVCYMVGGKRPNLTSGESLKAEKWFRGVPVLPIDVRCIGQIDTLVLILWYRRTPAQSSPSSITRERRFGIVEACKNRTDTHGFNIRRSQEVPL